MIHFIAKKIKNLCIKVNYRWKSFHERRKLQYIDFSIISNNCWAGFVYSKFGLEYTTLTIGMGIVDDDYIKFLENMDYYLNLTPQFIDPKSAKDYEIRRRLYGREIDYPVARLDDIVLWFTHYSSPKEALSKWERRKKRINKNRMLVKWSQRYNQSPALLERFLCLPFKNKIAFVEPSCPINDPRVIKIPELEELNVKGGDETESTLRLIDIYHLLNSLQ